MLLPFALTIQAQRSMLDATFRKGGKDVLHLGNDDLVDGIALLNDGRILISGGVDLTAYVLKLKSNGVIDSSFGTGGIAHTINPGTSILIQPDGKIIVTGNAYNNGNSNNFSLERLNPNGTIDSTFNGIGYRIDVIRGQDECHAALLQPDGKIVLGGNGTGYPAFARYKPNGSFDSSFGTNGKIIEYRFGNNAAIYSVLLQPDGKIVAIGNVYNVLGPPPPPPMKNDFLVLRYKSNGTPDSSFGINGIVITDLGHGNGEYDFAYAGALQPDGKILAAGSTEPIGGHFAMARYLPNGNLDSSFGDDRNGVVITDVTRAGASDIAYSMALQANGKIVLGGRSRNATNTFAVARYLPNGSLDSAWGNDGTVNTDMGGYNDQVNAIAIQSDGKIIAVGYAKDSIDHSTLHTAIARYLDESPTTVPGIIKPASGFRVYPNPSSGSFTLFATNKAGNASVVVTDVTGKAILNTYHDFNNVQKMKINLSSVSPGIYMVKITTPDRLTEVFKLVQE